MNACLLYACVVVVVVVVVVVRVVALVVVIFLRMDELNNLTELRTQQSHWMSSGALLHGLLWSSARNEYVFVDACSVALLFGSSVLTGWAEMEIVFVAFCAGVPPALQHLDRFDCDDPISSSLPGICLLLCGIEYHQPSTRTIRRTLQRGVVKQSGLPRTARSVASLL